VPNRKRRMIINVVNNLLMKKIVRKDNNNESELWFNWLNRKLNSYEAFKDFASGQDPEDVAEKFIEINSLGISNIFDKFDEEDKDTLDQFQKLTECECHVFRILKKQLELRNKVTFVDFKRSKKVKK
tara:strand:- start:503 stop:883 length:381 start_codon:yes stop_codon:yes gene_type:complete